MLSFEKSIAICLKTVEERFDKGGSEQWSTQDFVQLAEAIHAKTWLERQENIFEKIRENLFF